VAQATFARAVLATDAIQLDHDASRGSAVVGVKSTEHARDHGRLGRVRSGRKGYGYALAQPLVRPALVEVALVLT
jgi:hypothetical protein